MTISPSDELLVLLLLVSGFLAILIIGGAALEAGEWIYNKLRR
jgi:hypothetical protein